MYRPQWFPIATGRDMPMTSRFGIERNNKVFLTNSQICTLSPVPIRFPIHHRLQKDPRWPDKLTPLPKKPQIKQAVYTKRQIKLANPKK